MGSRPILSEEALGAKHWNPYTHTMSRAQLDKFHLNTLMLQVRYVYNNSVFYRKLFDKVNLKPEDIKTLTDFKNKVPLVDKSDLIASQEYKPPYGDLLALPADRNLFHFETSGTTGTPLNEVWGDYSTIRDGENWATLFWSLGIRPGDTFYFAFNWGMFVAFWGAYWGVRRLGGVIYSGGGQTTEGHVQNIMRLKPKVLLGTPTYVLRIAECAKDMGFVPQESAVKYVITAGEPGSSVPGIRKELEERWGALSGEVAGASELGTFSAGCPTRLGVHLNEMNFFSWSRDPETGLEVKEGEVGENIVTSLDNVNLPLINYRTHDLVRRYENYDCSCGRTFAFFEGGILGRTDHMVLVKGTNVYLVALENILVQLADVSDHYVIELLRNGPTDDVCVRFEPTKEAMASRCLEQVGNDVKAAISQQLRVTIQAVAVATDTLERDQRQHKAKRVIDLRHRAR